MKKVVLWLFFSGFILSGCMNDQTQKDNFDKEFEKAAQEIKNESPDESINRKNTVDYIANAEKMLKLAEMNPTIEHLNNATDAISKLPKENKDFNNRLATVEAQIKRKNTMESLQQDAAKKNDETRRKKSSDSNSLSHTSSSESSDNTNESNSQSKINTPNEDQKELLIAWTQIDCENRNVKLEYKGKDKWNIALNNIDGVNNWIVTTNDQNHGRVKAIYRWSGSQNSGAELVYLLISGSELVNTM